MILQKVRKDDENQRLDKYVKKLLPNASTSFLYKMMRKKNITLNKKKCEGKEILQDGDEISFFFSDETFLKFKGESKLKEEQISWKEIQKKYPIEIIQETEDFLYLNKPAGILSQKAKPEDFSVNEFVLAYLHHNNKVTEESLETFKPSVCNRLDCNTTGIIIAAKTYQGAKKISAQLKERSVHKFYHCIVQGVFSKEQNLVGYLEKDEKRNIVTIKKHSEDRSKYIETRFIPLKIIGNYTLLEVELKTGRTHQIRAHLASLQHPILGDPKYGDKRSKELAKRQMLHAYRLELEDHTTVIASYPKDFQACLDRLQK